MKTNLLLFLILAVSLSPLKAQNTIKNPSLQLDVEEGFQYLSFTIYGFDSEEDKQSLIQELEGNQKLKNISISEHNQFRAYVQKDYLPQLKSFFNNKGLVIQAIHTYSNNVLRKVDKEHYKQVFNDNRPLYENTGNRELDIKQYETRKKRWIEENPKKYKKITNSTIN